VSIIETPLQPIGQVADGLAQAHGDPSWTDDRNDDDGNGIVRAATRDDKADILGASPQTREPPLTRTTESLP
jgi:hypothetical protein